MATARKLTMAQAISEAIGQMKRVPLDSDILQTARDLGISFCEPD